MAAKLIALLTPISHFFQNGSGSISAKIGSVAPIWLILGAVVIVLLIAIFSLEKPKAISMLLIIYTIGFILMLIPAVTKWINHTLKPHDLYYAKIALAALPIAALLVHKYKKRR